MYKTIINVTDRNNFRDRQKMNPILKVSNNSPLYLSSVSKRYF